MSSISATYQLCSQCEGKKVVYKAFTYGYLGSYVDHEEHACPRCGGTGIELKPENSEKILAELLQRPSPPEGER